MHVCVHFSFLPIPDDHRCLISPQSMKIKLRTRLLKVREKITNEMCCEILSKYCLVTKRFVGTCEMITTIRVVTSNSASSRTSSYSSTFIQSQIVVLFLKHANSKAIKCLYRKMISHDTHTHTITYSPVCFIRRRNKGRNVLKWKHSSQFILVNMTLLYHMRLVVLQPLPIYIT